LHKWPTDQPHAALASALLGKTLKGVSPWRGLNLGGSIEPIHNPIDLVELALEKGSATILVPVSCRRPLVGSPTRPPPRSRASTTSTRRTRSGVFDRRIGDAGHDDLYDRPAFVEAMREALARIEAAAAGKVAGATGDAERRP